MKKVLIAGLIGSLLTLGACNCRNDDKETGATGQKILKSLVSYQVCVNKAGSLDNAELTKKNDKIEELKKNPVLAKEVSELDKACTEPERKIQLERASCSVNACTGLSEKTEDINKYIGEKCPDTLTVPSWSKTCREAYAKVTRHIVEANAL